MKTYTQDAYQSYLNTFFGNQQLPKTQYTELKRAFFGGAEWLRRSLIDMSYNDNDEIMMRFLADITKEFQTFLNDLKNEHGI